MTAGLSATVSPAVVGVMADRWVNAEYLYAMCHLFGGLMLLGVPRVKSEEAIFWILLCYNVFYQPTLALATSVSFTSIQARGMDVARGFALARAWGPLGFFAASWTIPFVEYQHSSAQFYVAAAGSCVLVFFSLALLPRCPPTEVTNGRICSQIGLKAFRLFKRLPILIFFIFAAVIGAFLRLPDPFTGVLSFLISPSSSPSSPSSSSLPQSSTIPLVLALLSQLSELAGILLAPALLLWMGVKSVMLLSMMICLCCLNLFLLTQASPLSYTLAASLLSGLCLRAFTMAGALYVDGLVPNTLRSSAQGIFLMILNGVGGTVGTLPFYLLATSLDGVFQVWLLFASCAVFICVLLLMFVGETENVHAASIPYRYDPRELLVDGDEDDLDLTS